MTIGVFTVLRNKEKVRFYDGLRITPEYERLWPRVMLRVLETLGAGAYEYGWVWSGEPERASSLEGIDGVKVRKKSTTYLYCVDFSEFNDWDDYFRTISENVRRNYKKAKKRSELLEYDEAQGFFALRIMLGFLRVRQSLGTRKVLPGNVVRAGLGFLGKLVMLPSESHFVRARVVQARTGAKTVAAMRMGEFGTTTYYFDGATAGRDDGSGWFLMIEVLKSAFERAPDGRFLLGWHLEGSDGDLGLERSRASLRPKTLRTNLVEFEWTGNKRTVSTIPPSGMSKLGARLGGMADENLIRLNRAMPVFSALAGTPKTPREA